MLKTKVKAGNITNLSDARYCAGMGVDWLGFPIESIDPKTFKEITSWVTGPKFVLEIPSNQLPESLSLYPSNTLQISYHQLKEIESQSNQSLIISMPMPDWPAAKKELLKHSLRIIYLQLTTLSGQKTSDKDLLKEIGEHFEILINFESTPYSLNEILEFPIAGISISGNQEIKPGLKDYSQLSDVLEQLESD
jgi:phosphoribosylanthranilate isomerase